MNLDDLKNTWKEQDEMLDETVEINSTMLANVKLNRQLEKLRQMSFFRKVESVIFFIIITSLWQYIVTDISFSAPIVSAFILNIFAIIGLAGNIGQIVLISKIDYSNPVNVLQNDILAVCSHKLQLTKLLILSVPFYMAYVFLGFDVLFGVDLFQHLEQQMILFYSVTSALLFLLTAWFLVKLNYRHIDTIWIKNTVRLIVGDRLIDLAQFVNNMNLENPKHI